MTPSYTYDLSTDVGKVRFSIGDQDISTPGAGVKPDGANFTDDELTFLIGQAGSWRAAVPAALRTLANLFASQAKTVQMEEYREDFSNIVDNLHKAAAEWEAKNATTDAPQYSGFSANTDAPAMFHTGQWGARVTED